MDCPTCGETAPDGATWCEACGADLSTNPPDPCVACGERQVGEDGYCMACGHKQPAPRDHFELEDGPVAAASDKGRRHHHNEDAVAIGVVPGGPVVLVVCDGVSSTPGSDEAAMAASAAARDLLVSRLSTEPDGSVADFLTEAAATAQEHAAAAPVVAATGPFNTGGPPSCTFVASVAQPVAGAVPSRTIITTAWVGDSRAYWIGDGEALRLTEDHEIGGSLIRWLGADSVEPVPDIHHLQAEGQGVLVVCSDGLWRYANDPADLAELVNRLKPAPDEASTGLPVLAAGLVTHALEGGGHDNVTVALWATGPATA